MNEAVLLRPEDPDYPLALANLSKKPVLRTSGPLVHHRRSVAIVGSREPVSEAVEFARDLAKTLASAGVLVVSGGAVGIDAAAHEAAMEAGTTWCVAPNGKDHPFPKKNVALFERIAASERSRMIWPFDDDQQKTDDTPKQRNRILVGLAKAVVVVQAHFKSGSRNAAKHARSLGRPLFVVPASPWMPAFSGSLVELARGARVLVHPSQLFHWLNLPWEGRERWPFPVEQLGLPNLEEAPEAPETSAWTEAEKSVFSVLSTALQHADEVVARTGLPTGATLTALLTLSLKDVVVEGPDGFYRRR
jgi:DNA processing protein